MITLHTCVNGPGTSPTDLAAATIPRDIVWIDMLRSDEAEIAFVEKETGLRAPSAAELSEIESSSRLRNKDGAFYLSMPLVFRDGDGAPRATSLGLILTRERFVTVRFEKLDVIRAFAERAAKREEVHPSSAGAFVGLLEEIVDRGADALEKVGTELAEVSQGIFCDPAGGAKPVRPARETEKLRDLMRRAGRGGDLASDIRDSLLGVGRIAPFVTKLGAEWIPKEVAPRLETLGQDIASLDDYEAHLASKVQLLLDAAVGLIGIEQNNIIKVLTIVSVVGVPPTLVASMYGMNFHFMPELGWAWGYPYGLALIAISAVAPLLWFKRRGWL